MDDAPRGGPYHGDRFRRDDRPLVYAHRGASAERPENTCEAFALASRQGADAVECDVRFCASGELVVCHDETLRRLAHLPIAVRDLPLSELRRIPILEERFPGCRARVPSLAEAVESAGGDMLWNVEIKVDRHEEAEPLARATAREVARLGLQGRVVVSSFHPLALLAVRTADRTLPTAYLWEGKSALGPWWHAMWGRLCATRALHPPAALVGPEAVRRWHRSGHLVNAWTVDDPAELERLRACGVDGVITNVPALALRTFGRAYNSRTGAKPAASHEART